MKQIFKELVTVVATIYGVARAIIDVWSISGTRNVSNRLIFIIALIFFSALSLTAIILWKYKKLIENGIRFKIISFEKDEKSDLFYTHFSKNLRIGTIVTIYYCSENWSKILGYGKVRNSSTDEYIEIEVLHIKNNMKDIFDKSQTDHRIMRDMYILPNTYTEILPELNTILYGGDSNNDKS